MSLNFYVFFDHELPVPKWGGEEFITKVDQIEPELDKLVSLYRESMLTFEEIAEETDIDWWTIKQLFKIKGVPTISVSERARRKRAKDFDLIYQLHFERKKGLNEIYREYGFSPSYVKAVLKDRRLKPVV